MRNGTGFDCASEKEIKIALRLGAKPSDIVYSNSIKNERDLIYADRKKVYLTTADSIGELIKIQRYAPKSKILWRIAIKE
jgi:ornithine decarboxylase